MPARPTQDELERLIGGLNETYGLDIRRPDQTMSPSKRRQLLHSEAQERVEKLYIRIHRLHFNNGALLSTCMGQFHAESRQLLSGGPELGSRSSLQLCLLRILDQHTASHQVKRSLASLPDPQVKRPKSRENETPHRTTVGPGTRQAGLDVPAANSPSSGPTILAYFTRSCSKAPSTSSTRASFESRVSLSSEGTGTGTSQTTLDNGASSDPSAEDLYPACTQEYQALDESFSKFNSSAEQPRPHVKGPESQTLEQRLRGIWPKLPPGLREAPLAVTWEVTRIAQHCGVEISGCDLTYESNERWRDQSNLRTMLASQIPFLGKAQPHQSDQRAWMTGLDTFLSDDSFAVMLLVDLVYRRADSGPLFDVHLRPLCLQLSHRLQRRFGADRFLEVTIPSPTDTNEPPGLIKNNEDGPDMIIRWLTQKPHYFLGRRWAAFSLRDAKKTLQKRTSYRKRVYFFACDGDEFRTGGSIPPLEEALTPGIRTKLPVSGLLEWALALQHNCEKPVLKLFSRFALSLTQTWPSITLERDQIRHRAEDIGTHEVMNDGIGRMSKSLAKKIARSLGLSDFPACYQGRIGNAKGIWIIDLDDDGSGDDDWLETYPSQRKWECDFQDPHHRTFEVKNWPRKPKSASLNRQTITVLEAQAVDRSAMRRTIAEHLKTGLLADLDAQGTAMGHPADLRLWLRQTGPSKSGSLLHGYVPFLAGLPKSDEDALAYLLDAGFDQRKLQYIRERSWALAMKRADQLKTTLHIEVPQSAYMLMVADLWSILEEGEVHVSFSSNFQADGFNDTLLENMAILVGRSPTHLASDIQKVRVVYHPKLRSLKDVIVFSTKGKKPLADTLSGGDYDGDLAWVCWDAKIVDNFQNATVPECLDLSKNGFLRKLDLSVQDLKTTEKNADDVCAKFIYTSFSFNMQQSLLGKCTNAKDKLCYQEDSITSTGAVILSNLIGQLVDQAKQGILFSEDDWHNLKQNLLTREQRSHLHKDPEYLKDRSSRVPRMAGEVHILDFLKFEVALKVVDEALTEYYKTIKCPGVETFDGDLTQMYNDYEQKSENGNAWHELLKQLREDIEVVSKAWKTTINPGKDGTSDYATKLKELHEMWLNIKPREQGRLSPNAMQILKEDWSKDPHGSPWALLKASATFKFHYRQGSFTWRMAGRQLCMIKQKMTRVAGETAPAVVQAEMYASLRPDKKFIRASAAQRGRTRPYGSFVAMEEATEEAGESDDDGFVVDDA